MFGRILTNVSRHKIPSLGPISATTYCSLVVRSKPLAQNLLPATSAIALPTTKARHLAFFASRNDRNRRRPPPPSIQERIRRNVAKITEGGVGPIASIGLGASVLFGKAKYLLVALKLTKFTPLVSMVLSAGAYAMFFGWPYACGMVGLIFVHELGHALAMRHYGVPFSPMVFVPFMGAVIGMQDNPRNCYEEAVIALGGPVLGSVGAASLALTAPMVDSATTSQLLYALADWGYMINLFNLLPIGSLDGGRITSAISPWIGVAGLAGGGVLIAQGLVHNPIFYIIMLTGAFSTGSKVVNKMRTGSFYSNGSGSGGWGEDDGKGEWYYNIPRGEKATITVAYFGLIATLLAGMAQNNKHRKTPRQLQAERGNFSSGRDTGVLTWIDDFSAGDAYSNDIERHNSGDRGRDSYSRFDYAAQRSRRYFDDDDDEQNGTRR